MRAAGAGDAPRSAPQRRWRGGCARRERGAAAGAVGERRESEREVILLDMKQFLL